MSEYKSKLQLIGEIAQANNKNLELIEELNDKEDEIERLNNVMNEIYTKALDTSITSLDLRDYIINNLGSDKE